MTPRARAALQGARNSQEDAEGTQGPRDKGTPGLCWDPGSGGEQPKSPVPTPAPHSRFSSSSLGKWRAGEASPRREGLQEHLLCLWIIPSHVWIHQIQRGSSSSAPKAPKPPLQGNPSSFPRIPTKFCKSTSEHQNHRRKDFFHLSKESEGIQNKREGSALQKSPEFRERGKPLSSHQHRIQKYTLHGNIPLLGEVREYQGIPGILYKSGTPQSPSWMR